MSSLVPGVQTMSDLVLPTAESIMTVWLRSFRVGAPVGAASDVAPGSVLHCLARWCALAAGSNAEDDEADPDEDDDEESEDLDDEDFDDEDFLDDEDDDDLDDDENDDDELSDEDEITIDDDRT